MSAVSAKELSKNHRLVINNGLGEILSIKKQKKE
jgi:hypothetical protein